MPSERQTIKNLLKTKIVAASTGAGANVFIDHINVPSQYDKKVPFVNIRFVRELITTKTYGKYDKSREADFVIEVISPVRSLTKTSEELCDEITQAIEDAIDKIDPSNTTWRSIELSEIEMFRDQDAAIPVVVSTMSYKVCYNSAVPRTPIEYPDLERVDGSILAQIQGQDVSDTTPMYFQYDIEQD